MHECVPVCHSCHFLPLVVSGLCRALTTMVHQVNPFLFLSHTQTDRDTVLCLASISKTNESSLLLPPASSSCPSPGSSNRSQVMVGRDRLSLFFRWRKGKKKRQELRVCRSPDGEKGLPSPELVRSSDASSCPPRPCLSHTSDARAHRVTPPAIHTHTRQGSRPGQEVCCRLHDPILWQR